MMNPLDRDHTGKFIKGTKVNVGRALTAETRKKLSIKLKALFAADPSRLQKLIDSKKGRTQTLEHRQKNSNAHKGSNAYQWKGGTSRLQSILRKSLVVREWKRHILQRDDYTCQSCAKRGVALQIDHDFPFAFYPALRTEILNGRALCIPCHAKTPTFKSQVDIYA